MGNFGFFWRWLSIALGLYLLTSFVEWSWSPRTWGQGTRLMFYFMVVAFAPIISGLHIMAGNDRERMRRRLGE